ncbi:hypothetical protein P171DRAFT_273240 [Karstenula rhodostoma CBS 690.94]|uniref:Uncharacterized protein n=1 Tax=Karstenula rhodostoma CBS 690.94 TaxID=1392251 RepID=A0A9P4PKM3_9PLEO|nr:hypothetical protein P171DRAFT_273240 [Karstenula rhodostoma CBS 690.94]
MGFSSLLSSLFFSPLLFSPLLFSFLSLLISGICFSMCRNLFYIYPFPWTWQWALLESGFSMLFWAPPRAGLLGLQHLASAIVYILGASLRGSIRRVLHVWEHTGAKAWSGRQSIRRWGTRIV